MQNSEGLDIPKPNSVAPVIMIILAATMIGSSLGVVIADKNILRTLKEETTVLIGGSPSSQPAKVNPESLKSNGLQTAKSSTHEGSEVIATGLSSVGTIHYSAQANSTQMAFDLSDMSLVRMGKLSDPDRVYADLQDSRGLKESSRGLKARKELNISGDVVSRVRIAQYESGKMRIVMDLKRPCTYTYNFPSEAHSPLTVTLQP